ncbi:MAG: lipopolysaccharide kinase InaA family protein [Planctomycetota bacterium]|jgi:tRNA A-37 threonylcarbamoyl transferase component Bud32
MNESGFELLIKNTSTEKGKEIVHCQRLLRNIERRREVYNGLWDNRQVIVKLFSDKVHSRRHLRREWKGLQNLQHKGINSPSQLFKGETEDGRKAVVIEKIVNSSTVVDVFNNTNDKEIQFGLLTMVSRELANHHNKGVYQKDLHLGNFLLRGEELFAFDAGQMHFLHKGLGRKPGIKKLGLLLHAFLEEDKEQNIEQVCRVYIKARGWSYEESDLSLFKKQITREQKHGMRRVLKKYLRTNKLHLKVRDKDYLGMFERDFANQIGTLTFINEVDKYMDEGEILKDGDTSFVSRFNYGGNDLVVKRYNYMGILHSFRHTLKGSRAKKCWLNGLRLKILNIDTPRPLAYFEKYLGPFLQQSYLVTEYVEGVRLYDYLRESDRSKEQCKSMIKKVEELLDRLSKHRITHGDLKHTNILVANKGPVLTDLDAMKVHKLGWIYRRKRRRDFSRFSKGCSCSP